MSMSRMSPGCKPSAEAVGPKPNCPHGNPSQPAKRNIIVPASGLLMAPVTHTEPSLGWKIDFRQHYTRGPLIGASAFGQVFLGTHNESGSCVAVKTMTKTRAKLTRTQTLDRISKETSMMTRLQPCQGVIQLIDSFEDDDSVHIITELCQGGDLQQYVRAQGALDEAKLAVVAADVFKVVQGCHDLGVLHGDVKPGNFCLSKAKLGASCLKAIDFGCSQFLGSEKKRLTKRTGTPAFMSPEIYAKDYGHKADIWSAGVTLYWLFCQRLPFFQSEAAVRAAHRVEDIAAAVSEADIPYDFGPWLGMSPEGVDFVRKCLERNEMHRFSVEEALSHPWLAEHV